VLAARGVLDAGLAAELSAGVKVRNLIGHAYAALDPRKLHAAAVALQRLVDPYCAAVLAFAEAHPTG
jgi:uncharacterized protein YutE (UPF0331/DUF86 family)